MRYPVDLRFSQEDNAWIADIYDLPGCMADGPTPEDALRAAQKAIDLWIEQAMGEQRAIPKPSSDEEASGRFLVRVSKSLHGRLQQLARREGVSLNSLVMTLLAEREALHRDR